MALISCPECAHEISSAARSCPHCGYGIPQRKRSGMGWGGWLVLAFLGFAIFLAVGVKDPNDHSARPVHLTATCNAEKASALVKQAVQSGLFYKLEDTRSVPRIYVTPAWYLIPIDEKKTIDGVLQCHLTKGLGEMKLAVYHDSRTGKEVAETGPFGFGMK